MSESGRPTSPTRRSLLFGGLLGVAGIAGLLGRETLDFAVHDAPVVDRLIPPRIGDWSFAGSTGLILPSEANATSFYDQELQRVYVSDRAPVMMLVLAYCAQPRQGLLQLHDPLVCYPGAGFSVGALRPARIAGAGRRAIEARSFVAVRTSRIEQVVYWTRIGDRIATLGEDQHLAIVASVLRGALPDGLLLRISSIGAGDEILREVLRFGAALVDSLSPPGRELLLGSSFAAT